MSCPIPYDEFRDACIAIRLLPETQARRVIAALSMMIGDYDLAICSCEELKKYEEERAKR